jgi:hypothetical protein
MADHKEVRYEHLYLKVPNTDRVRDTAAGRLKRLMTSGWRETERTQTPDYVRVRLERSGHAPLLGRIPHSAEPTPRPPRSGQGRGGPGGPNRGGPGGRGR